MALSYWGEDITCEGGGVSLGLAWDSTGCLLVRVGNEFQQNVHLLELEYILKWYVTGCGKPDLKVKEIIFYILC